ncbi:hypothetical protein HK405_010306 [Cladochytrium tenue]|nr:hypothetical protein HK405_010306 [Cladochytrium tenue]
MATLPSQVLRCLNVAWLAHMTVSNQLFIHRRRRPRTALDWVLLAINVSSLTCIFVVAVNIVLLPLVQTSPRTVFQCNFFERVGNATHFLMFVLINVLLYLKVASTLDSMPASTRPPALLVPFHAGSAVAVLSFVAIDVYEQSFPLDDPESCFFGVPGYVGHVVVACIAFGGAWFFLWFWWLLSRAACFKDSARFKAVIHKALFSAVAATLMEVLCFEILNLLITDPDVWNLVLHVDISLNNALMIFIFSDPLQRLTSIPFFNYWGTDQSRSASFAISTLSSNGSSHASSRAKTEQLSKRPSAVPEATRPMTA